MLHGGAPASPPEPVDGQVMGWYVHLPSSHAIDPDELPSGHGPTAGALLQSATVWQHPNMPHADPVDPPGQGVDTRPQTPPTQVGAYGEPLPFAHATAGTGQSTGDEQPPAPPFPAPP